MPVWEEEAVAVQVAVTEGARVSVPLADVVPLPDGVSVSVAVVETVPVAAGRRAHPEWPVMPVPET